MIKIKMIHMMAKMTRTRTRTRMTMTAMEMAAKEALNGRRRN